MASGTKYPLARDYLEILRLDYQHFLMRDLMGGLHSSVLPVDKSNLKVADVGTGTGCVFPVM